MIDYDKEDDDPIVAEVRRAREELAAKFNYDLRAMMTHFQRLEASSGRAYVSPPASAQPDAPVPAKKVG